MNLQVLLTSVLVLILGEPPQMPFVDGQVQQDIINTPRHSMQHTPHHSHRNHHELHHHQHHSHHNHREQENEQRQHQQDFVNFKTSLQRSTTTHHTRHRHEQQNNYQSNNIRKHQPTKSNHTAASAATTKPATILSHNIEYYQKLQNKQQQQTTTSSPVLNSSKTNNNNNNSDNNDTNHHNRMQNHHHYHRDQHYGGESENGQKELRAHHHYHQHHQQNQNENHQQQRLPPEGANSRIATKPVKSDAFLRQNFEIIQDNRIDLQRYDRIDIDDDDDDYYYQDENDDNIGMSDGNESENSNYYGDAEMYSPRDHDHEYARVARDHQSNYRHFDQDYANDEPSQSNYGQVSALLNNTNTKPGVLTEQKYRELGTLESVQKSRDKYYRARTEHTLAQDHIARMTIAARCSRPMPRVVYVSNETSKTYLPRATILYRCGPDTGCCTSTAQVCTVKTYEDVELYFFVVNLADEFNTVNLVLRNHTECHCVDRSNLTVDSSQRRGKRSGIDSTDGDVDAICRCPRHYDVLQENERPTVETFGHSSEQQRQHHQHQQQQEQRQQQQEHEQEQQLKQQENNTYKGAHQLPPAVQRGNINCRCDCLSTNMPCQRLKDGKEGFSIEDRNCIASKKCLIPNCRLGAYNHRTGRCPRLRNHKHSLQHKDNGYG